jgi:acetyl esterase/lipase
VVSPEYRLAPEHPYPAAPDDCEAVARWLLDTSEKTFGTRTLGIYGGSAGAHLAALTLLRLQPSERQAFRGAVLFYGVYDLGRSEAWRNSTWQEYPDLCPEEMDVLVEWFLPGLDDQARRAPEYSPLSADLHSMPAALFLVGGADLMAGDSRRMAQRWVDHGNSAELVEYAGAPHAFDHYPNIDCGLDPAAYAAEFLSRCVRSSEE